MPPNKDRWCEQDDPSVKSGGGVHEGRGGEEEEGAFATEEKERARLREGDICRRIDLVINNFLMG